MKVPPIPGGSGRGKTAGNLPRGTPSQPTERRLAELNCGFGESGRLAISGEISARASELKTSSNHRFSCVERSTEDCAMRSKLWRARARVSRDQLVDSISERAKSRIASVRVL